MILPLIKDLPVVVTMNNMTSLIRLAIHIKSLYELGDTLINSTLTYKDPN